MLNPKAYIEGHRHLLNSLKLQSNKRSREDTQWFTAHTTHLHLELEAAPVSKESDTLRYSQIYSDALFCSPQALAHTWHAQSLYHLFCRDIKPQHRLNTLGPEHQPGKDT